MFEKHNPKTNKKWKSRNEFYDYFVMVTNNNINDESQWVKTTTVKRWITQYLTAN